MAKNKPNKEVKEDVAKPIREDVDEAAKEEAKEEVKPEEKVESKSSKFINNGKDVKIRIGSLKDFKWITVKHGDIVELDALLAKANKLQLVE